MPTLQKISEAYYVALPVETLKQFNWGKGTKLITTTNPETQTITISKDPNQPADKVTIFMQPKNKLPNPQYLNSIEDIKKLQSKVMFTLHLPPKKQKKAMLELQIRQNQLELEQLKTKRKKAIPVNQEQQTV